jgi:Zn-dependent membrane protease YugP
MFFDPLQLILVGPFLILGIWAQFRVKSAFARGSQIHARSGLSGAQVARAILDRNDMRDVDVEVTQGMLSDHFDPKAGVVRLSPEVYGGTNLAALGVAAHECGHALQKKTGYELMTIRNAAVPMANIGTQMSWIIFFVGLMLTASAPVLGHGIMWVGVGLFSLVVFFQVVNLPVEFNASSRAKQILVSERFITEDELPVVKSVLGAAAMTYVAATLTAVATLIFYILRAQGDRR